MKNYKPTIIREVYPIDSPCTKMMYKSEEEARGAILYLKHMGHIELDTYCCMKCGFYHLTKK